MHAFEYPRVDPRFNDVFNKSMLSSTTININMKRIFEFYQGFEHVTKLIDVGGDLGHNLKLITAKYPHIRGINFDLPHVLQNAPNHGSGFLVAMIPAAPSAAQFLAV
ncbi:caffeic acid 3-O-methyltransferase [Trifolium repens]|nr:caffeic acid 3-O-methyltransferase [Trifolium repens]